MSITKSKHKFIFGNYSDSGRERTVNEDYFGNFSTPNGYVFIVCDGMGGHVGGEKASHIAVDAIKDFLISNTCNNPQEALYDAIVYANNEIIKYAKQQPELSGMGSTCVVMLIKGSMVYYAHAGDSRIYQYVANEIKQLTLDHSFVQSLVSIGEISKEEADNHPRKNEITNALGLMKMRPAVCDQPLPALINDCFLLCTDGLTGMINDETIKSILNENICLQEKAEKLVRLANDAGGTDNITVQLVQFTASDYKKRSIGGLYNQEKIRVRQILLFALPVFLILSFGLVYFLNVKATSESKVPAAVSKDHLATFTKKDSALHKATNDTTQRRSVDKRMCIKRAATKQNKDSSNPVSKKTDTQNDAASIKKDTALYTGAPGSAGKPHAENNKDSANLIGGKAPMDSALYNYKKQLPQKLQ